jgi:hypothetical protein
VPALASPVKTIGVVVALAAFAALAPAAGAFEAHGGIKNAYVIDAKKGQKVQLLDKRGHVVASGRADRLGSKVFREVKPGKGYRIRRGGKTTRPFQVLRPARTPSSPSTSTSSSSRASTT